MSPEPKKPIEELLEASAKARRAEFGADPKMPNPMRARLHEEIARLGQEKEPTTRSGWFNLWWPRLAIGAALTSLVIVASVVWWERPQSSGERFTLATREPLGTNNANEAELDKAFREGGSALRGEAKVGEQNSNALKKFAEVAITPATQAPAAKGSELAEKKSADLQSELLADQKARVAAGGNKSAPTQSPAAAPGFASSGNLAANLRQQFSQNLASQAFRSNAKLKQQLNVLNTFQIEQVGSQIRVVDADGSTYTGNIEPEKKSATRSGYDDKDQRNYAAQSPRAAGESAQEAGPATNEFYFRASGYNRGLKKSLVLEANYIPAPSQQNAPRDSAATESVGQMSARIVGTAKIRGESPIQVDAVSVAP